MKTFLLIVTAIVAILLAGVAYVYVNLDSIAKDLIESVASEQLQVPVRIDTLDIRLGEKSANLEDLTVGNPSGFSSEPILSVADISTRLADISADLITIETLEVGDIDILLEVANGTTNIQALQKNLISQNPSSAVGSAESKSGESAVPDVIIEKVVFGNTTLKPVFPAAATRLTGELSSITVPGFTITNVGTGSGGVTPAQAMQQILRPYLRKLEEQAVNGQLKSMLPADLRDLDATVREKAADFQKNIEQETQRKLKETTGDIRKNFDEGTGKVLNNIFGSPEPSESEVPAE